MFKKLFAAFGAVLFLATIAVAQIPLGGGAGIPGCGPGMSLIPTGPGVAGGCSPDMSPVPNAGGGGGTTINIPDTNTPPANKYAVGQYLAIQSINDFVSARTQSMTVNTATFPNNTVFDAAWPAGADNSVKSWNAIDFGDYLQTVTPLGVRSARIADITSAVSTHSFTYTDDSAGQGGNVAIDGFFYKSQDSYIANMVAEWQVYFHLPTATKAFIDAQPAVGSYVSAPIGATPSITWTVTRQTSNTQGTPYYLAYPTDTLDRTNIQFDLIAFWNYLKGLGYLTGYEYINSPAALGIEPLKGTTKLTVNSFSVSPYAATTIQDNVVTPWQTNLIPSQSFATGTWDLDNATGLTNGFTETAATGNHRAYLQTNPVTASASKQYSFSVDLDPTNGQPYVHLQVFRQDYGAVAAAYFDLANLFFFQSNNSTFTGVQPSIRQLSNGKYRCTLTFTTDASTTALKPFIESTVYDPTTLFYNTSYPGDVSKTLGITNIYLYDPAELSPYFSLEARQSLVYQTNTSNLGAFANGDVVGKFVDTTSGGISPGSVANDTTRPTLQGVGVKPYLLFDGVNDLLNTNSIPGGSTTGMGNKNVASTLVIVFRSVGTPALGAVLVGNSQTGGTTNLWYVKASNATATTASFRIVDNAGVNVLLQDTINAANVFDGNDHVLIVTDSGTNITFYLDGTQVATQAYTPNSTFAFNRFNIGALQRATTIGWFPARIYAVKGFPGVLSAPDIARLNTYSAALK